jgi:hypothetical protein
MLSRLLRQQQRFIATRDAKPSRPMHVEVRLDLASLLGEQHGQQESRPEPAAEEGEQARTAGGAVRAKGPAVLREQVGPDLEVTIFDVGQAAIDVLLLRVRLGLGEEAVEKRRVGLVLPVVLECVEVGGAGRNWFRRGRCCHALNMAGGGSLVVVPRFARDDS